MRLRNCFLILTAIALISACGPKNLVVLVPDPDGSVGGITVSNQAGSVAIDAPYQFTAIKDIRSSPSAPAPLASAEIDSLFGQALAIQPQRPKHFLLHFDMGTTDLLPESAGMLADIESEIRKRGSEWISIVGHTDTLGDKAANIDLSRRRADAIKMKLIQWGINQELIEVSSHGEENPLAKTADNVGNAENRRVEVIVR